MITKHIFSIMVTSHISFSIFFISLLSNVKKRIAKIISENIIQENNHIRNSVDTFKCICNYLEEPYQYLSNTKNNIEQINLNIIPPGELINGEKHINLRKWKINQPLYDNIEESRNKLRHSIYEDNLLSI